MLYFIVVMYCFLLYVYFYNWASYLGQDTPGKEIFNLSEVLSWLNKGIYISVLPAGTGCDPVCVKAAPAQRVSSSDH